MGNRSRQASEIGLSARGGQVLAYTAIGLAAIGLPLVLLAADVKLIMWAGEIETCFRWFAFSGSLAVIAIAYLELRKRRGSPAAELVPVILWLLLSLHFLTIVTQYSTKQGDYWYYKQAAQRIVAGGSPYEVGGYVYPPLIAQALAGMYSAIEHGAQGIGVNTDKLNSWSAVFYLFECVQLILVIGLYWLGYLFARRLGLGPVAASVALFGLLIANGPLLDMLKWDQVNLWMTTTILLSILLVKDRPFLSGMAIALGAHIKLYPLIILGPWSLARQWKVLLSAVVGVVGTMVLLSSWGHDWGLWHTFINQRLPSLLENGSENISLHNLPDLTIKPLCLAIQLAPLLCQTIANWAKGLMLAAIIVWFALRFWQRETIYTRLAEADTSQVQKECRFHYRLYGHAMDAVALSLLISPTVWIHHYVLVIPIAIWAIATCAYKHPWHVGAAILLTQCLPTSAVFLFSYHRVVGLLMLVILTSPRSTMTPLESEEGVLAGILRR